MCYVYNIEIIDKSEYVRMRSEIFIPKQIQTGLSIFHELVTFFGALLREQNIIQIFSNLRVSTFKKSMENCPNR